jgi:hypothetical protein
MTIVRIQSATDSEMRLELIEDEGTITIHEHILMDSAVVATNTINLSYQDARTLAISLLDMAENKDTFIP